MQIQAIYVALTFLAFGLSSLGAQRTWIVDAAGGAGTDFRDLPPAIAAAQDGDVVRVRRGDYVAATITKAIAILGDPGARFSSESNGALAPPLVVEKIAAGKNFRLRGFAFAPNRTVRGLQPRVILRDNRGILQIEELVLDLPRTASANSTVMLNHGPTMSIERSGFVAMDRCTISGGLRVRSLTHVALTGGSYRGYGAAHDTATPSDWVWHAIAGFELIGATAQITNVQVLGGNGIRSSLNKHAHVASPGVFASSGVVYASGLSSSIAAGIFEQNSRSAMIASSTILFLQPGVRLKPTGNAPAYRGFIHRAFDPPVLTGNGGDLGGRLDLDVRATPGRIWILYASLPRDPFTYAPLRGIKWLDPRFLIVLGGGMVSASGSVRMGIPVPQQSTLAGLGLVFQSLDVDFTKSIFEWSNPVMRILH